MEVEIPLLKELLIIFGLSIGVLLICARLKVPVIVGFLVTGILSGPHGFQFISALSDVNTLAKIGVIFLLFAVGLEFSFKKMVRLKRFFLFSGACQVFVTSLLGFLIASYIGAPPGEALFLGFLLSLSSTTIVLRLLEERNELQRPYGKLVLGILIFQDIIVVPMLLLIPLIGGEAWPKDASFIWVIGESIIILFLVFFLAKWFVPRLLFYVARTKIRELFLLSVLIICFSVAWVASMVGLPLSIGAFLAGMILAESEYSLEALGDILPFRDIFISLFFVSIGMLLDLGFVLDHYLLILIVSCGVFLLKSLIMFGTGLLSRVSLRTSIRSGIALHQVGEFSFILAKAGIAYGIGSDFHYQLFLSVAILSMGLTPTLIAFAPKLADHIASLPFPNRLKVGLFPIPDKRASELKEHMVLIGFDVIAANLVHVAKETEIPYVIIDMDPEVVKREKAKGEPILFGDATHMTVLKHADIERAKAAIILIHDPLASFRIVEMCRRLNPNLYLVARTRYLEEVQPMFQLGADEVIPDEFGSALEIFLRVLEFYGLPKEIVDKMVTRMRQEGYDHLRIKYGLPRSIPNFDLQSAGVDVRTFRVNPASVLVGKTLQESGLKDQYEVTVLMISRGETTISHLTGETKIYADDLLVIMGSVQAINRVAKLFNPVM